MAFLPAVDGGARRKRAAQQDLNYPNLLLTTLAPVAPVAWQVRAPFDGQAYRHWSKNFNDHASLSFYTPPLTGVGAITEQPDVCAGVGAQGIAGTGAIQEGADSCIGFGTQSNISGIGAILESQDICNGTGTGGKSTGAGNDKHREQRYGVRDPNGKMHLFATKAEAEAYREHIEREPTEDEAETPGRYVPDGPVQSVKVRKFASPVAAPPAKPFFEAKAPSALLSEPDIPMKLRGKNVTRGRTAPRRRS